MARKQEIAALEARRFEAARWLARGASQATIVARFGVSRQTAHRWYHAWAEDGRAGLEAAGRLGRRPRLDHQQLARVDTALRDGPRAHGFPTDLWTLPRMAEVIARLTGVRYHPGHVWYLLRRLGWSLQRPARRARERDEAAIRRWVTQRWPTVKKTLGAATPGSSSRTKAAFRRSPSSAAPGPPAARRPS
jgi:transposase